MYEIDSEVQLVCKYLQAYENPHNLLTGINKLCREQQSAGK